MTIDYPTTSNHRLPRFQHFPNHHRRNRRLIQLAQQFVGIFRGDGNQQSTGRLRIVQNRAYILRHAVFIADQAFGEFAIRR